MKAIIKNRKYDTETARECGAWTDGKGWRDFSHVEETLYCKRTGEYFLYGQGGPASRYAESAGQNSWSGGSKLIPLTYESARAWAEEHLSTDAYEAEFGEVVEDESAATLILSLTVSTVETIRRRAREQGMTVSGYIASLIK